MRSPLEEPPPRGVALVEAVIRHVTTDASTMWAPWPAGRPVPLPAEQLDALVLPGGQPLPPSLRRWLAFDASWLGWFTDTTAPLLRPEPLTAWMGDSFAVFAPLLPGDLYHHGERDRLRPPSFIPPAGSAQPPAAVTRAPRAAPGDDHAYDARTIRRLIARGELPVVGEGRLRRVPMQSLHEYQERTRC